jgi:hypothetical protein
MIEFVASTFKDISRIQRWTDADIYHKGQNSPSWWVTGQGLLSFSIHDEKGPLFFVRMDSGEYIRLSVQFAPLEEVGKLRLIRAMLQTLPKLIEVAKKEKGKGLIFDSESPTLVRFMEKMGFKNVGDDSYRLAFGE